MSLDAICGGTAHTKTRRKEEPTPVNHVLRKYSLLFTGYIGVGSSLVVFLQSKRCMITTTPFELRFVIIYSPLSLIDITSDSSNLWYYFNSWTMNIIIKTKIASFTSASTSNSSILCSSRKHRVRGSRGIHQPVKDKIFFCLPLNHERIPPDYR